MRFTIRDLAWAMVVVALLASHASHRLDIQRALVERDLRWNKLARDAEVIRQIQREQVRQLFER